MGSKLKKEGESYGHGSKISFLHGVRERSLLVMVTCFIVTVQNKMILVIDSYEDIIIITIYHFNKL